MRAMESPPPPPLWLLLAGREPPSDEAIGAEQLAVALQALMAGAPGPQHPAPAEQEEDGESDDDIPALEDLPVLAQPAGPPAEQEEDGESDDGDIPALEELPGPAQAPGPPAWALRAECWLPERPPPGAVPIPGTAVSAGDPLHLATEAALGCAVDYRRPGDAPSSPAADAALVVLLGTGPDGLATLECDAVEAAVAGCGGELLLSRQPRWEREAHCAAPSRPPQAAHAA